ncbi:hypothetical protein H6F77_11770 [Microcoleus sp. FACHB-831]|uniref:hypothetical protein n=1 Tax=Microcoleus sp. FACHB-831 TaxID=2692827 RepID=UPI00168788AE|nr:hypothetical protein [Microcoleus sp. FACHB-831]MBD1921769.1 hypothetical protein [Microcoleus sp. FACHB-831]
MSIFGVSQGDAATFQEKYQQLIAQLISAMLKFKDKKENVEVQSPSNKEGTKEETINFEISEEEEQNRAINIQISGEVTDKFDKNVNKEIAAPMSDLEIERTALEPDLKAHPTSKSIKSPAGFLPFPTADSASKSGSPA